MTIFKHSGFLPVVFSGLSLALSGCSGMDLEEEASRPQAAVTTKAMTATAVSRWNSYVNSLPKDLQPECKPLHIPAKSPSASRGVVILFHGFTACPQQFAELGRRLSEQSFDVLIPLLPGHGRLQRQGVDVSDEIPGVTDWNRYSSFANQMNSIMEVTTGVQGISGISVGSAIAALANSRHPTLYDRSLIVTPHFENSNALLGILARSFNQNSVDLRGIAGISAERDYGWGEGCERERRLGRAGICNFKIKHFAGIVKFGDFALANLKKVDGAVQFVGVDNDPVINNSVFQQSMNKMWSSNRTNACFFRQPANHSLYSRYDTPWENKFWYESVHRASVDFFTSGRWFTTSHIQSTVGTFSRCATD